MALAADDEMVVERDAELVADIAHLMGHGDVGGRRRRVARRMVVDHN